LALPVAPLLDLAAAALRVLAARPVLVEALALAGAAPLFSSPSA